MGTSKQVEAALGRDPHISLRKHPLKIALDRTVHSFSKVNSSRHRP